MERVPIGSIRVGERRRQDLGDIEALARNIDRHGLIHPILISDEGELIAGERRLRACERLGWTEIDTRRWSVLSADERREIELAENLDRKDLTPYERSRTLVALAETAAEVLRADPDFSPESGEKSGRGRPKKTDSEERVAHRIGLPRQTIGEAKAHVAAVQAVSILADPSVPQYRALEAKAHLERLPEPEREEAARLVSQPGIDPRSAVDILGNLAEMPAERREEVFRLSRSDDVRDRDLALTTAANRPPMPDPRLTVIEGAVTMLRRAVKPFPDEPETPRFRAVIDELRAIARAIEERGPHVGTDAA